MRIYAGYDENTVVARVRRDEVTDAGRIKTPSANRGSKQCWPKALYGLDQWWPRVYGTIGSTWQSWVDCHESRKMLRIGDNNNNPYVTPYRRVGAGAWDVMDRGSFNGPGGPHRRWLIPVTEGGAAPAGLLLRQRMYFKFTGPGEVLQLNRDGLAQSGLAVGRVTARASKPLPNELTGILVSARRRRARNRTPPSDPTTDPLAQGAPELQLVHARRGAAHRLRPFTPSSGVLITKNKDRQPAWAGPESSTCSLGIDANPQDIRSDLKRPNGEVVMRTIADYRQ